MSIDTTGQKANRAPSVCVVMIFVPDRIRGSIGIKNNVGMLLHYVKREVRYVTDRQMLILQTYASVTEVISIDSGRNPGLACSAPKCFLWRAQDHP